MKTIPETREAWDERAFARAAYFSLVMMPGRTREEYRDFEEALARAEAWRDPFGRPPLVYAVTASNDSAPLGLAELRSRWLPKWKSRR